MAIFQLTESTPKTVIIQHVESGNYNYSYKGTKGAAIDDIKSDILECGYSEDEKEAHEMADLSLKEYTCLQVVEAAEAGYQWPIDLGFVTVLEE